MIPEGRWISIGSSEGEATLNYSFFVRLLAVRLLADEVEAAGYEQLAGVLWDWWNTRRHLGSDHVPTVHFVEDQVADLVEGFDGEVGKTYYTRRGVPMRFREVLEVRGKKSWYDPDEIVRVGA